MNNLFIDPLKGDENDESGKNGVIDQLRPEIIDHDAGYALLVTPLPCKSRGQL